MALLLARQPESLFDFEAKKPWLAKSEVDLDLEDSGYRDKKTSVKVRCKPLHPAERNAGATCSLMSNVPRTQVAICNLATRLE